LFDERTHFYCSFELGFEGELGWSETIRVIRDWLSQKLQNWSATANLDGDWFVIGDEQPHYFGHHSIDVAASAQSDNEPQLWSLAYQHDDASWHYRKWKTEISLSKQKSQLRFTLRLSHFVSGDWVGKEPALPTNTIPGVVTSFVKAGKALSGGTPLYTVPISVKSGHASLFRLFLESDQRELPIVLISKNADGETLVKPRVLARALTSIAFVCEVQDAEADYALSQVLPQNFRTFGGAVRLYLPGVNIAKPSDSFRHRYFRFDDKEQETGSVEALIVRAALRRVALQQDRSLVAVREVRLRNLVSLARAKDDVSTLVSALQEKVIRLEKVEDEQYNEYCGVVARLESCEGELREANEELKQKEFQVVVLTSALSEKSETVQEESPFQIFKSNIEAKQVQIPIICIRSKQDPSFIEAIAESLKVEPSELQDYFEEEIREYSSNLIKNLISAHSGKVVLYAHAHLKYFAPEGKKDFPEFFAGAKVRDSVSRFIQWIT
jgi:hypothetical protein